MKDFIELAKAIWFAVACTWLVIVVIIVTTGLFLSPIFLAWCFYRLIFGG